MRTRFTSKTRRGFTLLELVVVIGILVVLAGILIPYTMSLRERSNRAICFVHLQQLGSALAAYSHANGGQYPRVLFDADDPDYHAFTGPDAPDPFTAGSQVRPNDVTASLWLLVRGGYISSQYQPVTQVFVCPSTDDTADPLTTARGTPASLQERSNFRGPQHLSYSYAIPFGASPGYQLSADMLHYRFVLMADRNPGQRSPQDVTRVAPSDSLERMAVGNSRNHRRARQNVLFADMHVEMWSSPFAGQNSDNIYTVTGAGAAVPQTPATGETAGPDAPTTEPATASATTTPAQMPRPQVGRRARPSDLSDTYLVPTESD
jgi:prepilin-type N-terminal cleavage/methylation domain-containing protein